MCLAIPLRLIDVEGEHGTVDAGGIRRRIVISLVPGAKPGDYAIVHAGFAISLMDEEQALLSIRTIHELLDKAGS